MGAEIPVFRVDRWELDLRRRGLQSCWLSRHLLQINEMVMGCSVADRDDTHRFIAVHVKSFC